MKVNKKITTDLANFIKMRYAVDVTSTQEKYPELFKAFLRMQYWLDEVKMAEYFASNETAEEDGTYWTQYTNWDQRKTGQQLLQKIRDAQDLSPQIPLRILDVGCGDNEWKTHLGAKVIGIDPYNDKSDFKIDIQNYANEKTDKTSGAVIDPFDICLVLGSINFGDYATVEMQIAECVRLTKPGGKLYFRFNPGITHSTEQAQWIDFFYWTEEKINQFAKQMNCEVDEISWDHPEGTELRNGNRLYSEWTKSQTFNTVK